jgi:hypothetical protein
MSEADQFWEYAEEALQWANRSTIEKEKKTLLELARTWTQAARESDRTVVVNDSPPEARAP